MNMDVHAAARTDVGQARERNEDALFAGTFVFAVADGLGGHRAGEVASNLSLEPISELESLEPKRAAGLVADRVRKANRAVFDRADSDAGLKGMGTTMTAAVVYDGKVRLAHVGDSRCYLLRGDSIEQLSRDHTLVARMVTEGKLTQEQAEVHPQRSMLTRALGADRDVDVDEAEFTLEPGDRLLLCSDGLTGMLSDEDIRQLATDGADLDEICEHLVDEANARGGLDNITAVVIDIGGTWDIGAPRAKRAQRSGGRKIARHPRAVPVRLLVWSTLVLAVAAAGLITVRTVAHRSFYVGVAGGKVTIFRGLPVDFAGIHLSEPEQPTAIKAAEVQDYYLSRLEDGIRADSLAEACRIVMEQIPLVPRPTPTATPRAKATPTATPAPIPGCPP